jgi:HAD superfamily hydrolase (TIGR01549 family)
MQLQKYLQQNTKKHLIFDFDETIARIEMNWELYHIEMNKAYGQFDLEKKHPVFTQYGGYNDFVKKYGTDTLIDLRKANNAAEQRCRSGYVPYPELIDFIAKDKKFIKYVYSSNSRGAVVAGLEELGIDDKFVQLVTRDEVTFIKPDPEGFYLIYDQDQPKSDYLMIGNSHADQDMAQAAGIDFYLIEYFRPIF